jgi:predicted XRE-type DNA-binding protein
MAKTERTERNPGVGEPIGDDLFERFDLPNASELRARVDLAVALAQEIRGRGLTQTKAAEILGVTQPDISNLMRGNVDGFSQERLERLLNALDLDVRIQVGPKPAGQRAAGVRVERVSSFIS